MYQSPCFIFNATKLDKETRIPFKFLVKVIFLSNGLVEQPESMSGHGFHAVAVCRNGIAIKGSTQQGDELLGLCRLQAGHCYPCDGTFCLHCRKVGQILHSSHVYFHLYQFWVSSLLSKESSLP